MHDSSRPVGGVPLRQILPKARFFGGTEIEVASCCGDSRQCRQGDLFAALMGRRRDGHDYAAEAVRRGAAAILAERHLPVGVPTCIVDDTWAAYGRVCHTLAGTPSDMLGVLGITGTHGKTTTALLLTAILEAARERVGIMSSLGFCDGHRVKTGPLLEPTAPEYARWMAAMCEHGCSHAVIEASSAALSRQRLAGMQLDGAVFTNIRRAHLDLHGSVLNYRQIKRRLLDHLKPGGFAVFNADDPASKFLMSDADCPVITVGMQAEAEVTAALVERYPGSQTFLLSAGDESIPVETAIVGNHHIYNCLSAAAAALVLGIDLPTIARGLESLTHVPGRFERIAGPQPFQTYVDSASTPDALVAALKAARSVTEKRLICVFGAAGGGDPAERPLMGRVVERLADIGIVTRNNPCDEEPLQIAHHILDGYDRPAQAHLIPDRARAIGWALHTARPGDTVLIAGRGNEVSEMVGGQKISFDDREVARFFLREMAESASAVRKVA